MAPAADNRSRNARDHSGNGTAIPLTHVPPTSNVTGIRFVGLDESPADKTSSIKSDKLITSLSSVQK